jgi:putative hemolysin
MISVQTRPAAKILTAFIILAMFCLSTLCCATALAAQASTDPVRTHCVSSGYLYRTTPSLNGGQGICSFPDNSWCDANEFYNGSCGPRLTPNILPGYAFATGSTKVASMQEICISSGGRIKSVHTPYGDIAICVFPDGTTCDAKAISEGRCGADYWTIYAQSWLNAP